MFQDSVNRAVFQIPGTHLTRTLVYADAALVDGAVNKQATGVAAFGEASRRFQSGKVRSYAMLMLLGFLVLASIIVVGG
jgi:NADH-quinone oxidoreductase subunit L